MRRHIVIAMVVGMLACSRAQAQVDYDSAYQELHALLGRKYGAFRIKKIDWDAVGRELLPKAKDVKDDEAFGLLCLQMVARLQDSHAMLIEGRAHPPQAPLPVWDAGFACLVDDQDRPAVYWIDAAGPAAAHLKPGDILASINRKPAAEALAETMKLFKTWYSFSSDRVLQYDAVRSIANQMKQSDPIKLIVEDSAGRKRDVELKASHQTRYIPRLPVPIAGIPDSASVSSTILPDDIGYLRVRRIANDLPQALDRELKKVASVQGLIIDVRGNSGGGFDDSALRNFNLEDGREPLRPRVTVPIAILIDERCISAGEGWTSWFVANKKATLFGTATAGASSRKETHPVAGGLYKVVIPVKPYTGSLERVIEGRGIEPDVPVRCSAKDLAVGKDTVLETARQHLVDKSKKAAAAQ